MHNNLDSVDGGECFKSSYPVTYKPLIISDRHFITVWTRLMIMDLFKSSNHANQALCSIHEILLHLQGPSGRVLYLCCYYLLGKGGYLFGSVG